MTGDFILFSNRGSLFSGSIADNVSLRYFLTVGMIGR